MQLLLILCCKIKFRRDMKAKKKLPVAAKTAAKKIKY